MSVSVLGCPRRWESAPHTGLERGHGGTQPLILLPQNEVELGIG